MLSRQVGSSYLSSLGDASKDGIQATEEDKATGKSMFNAVQALALPPGAANIYRGHLLRLNPGLQQASAGQQALCF